MKNWLTCSDTHVNILFVPETGTSPLPGGSKKDKNLLTGSIWFDNIDIVAAKEALASQAAEAFLEN